MNNLPRRPAGNRKDNMTESMQPEFTCPRCGSHYFGRVTERGRDGNVVITSRVRCHGDSSGRTNLCDWQGEWQGEWASANQHPAIRSVNRLAKMVDAAATHGDLVTLHAAATEILILCDRLSDIYGPDAFQTAMKTMKERRNK